MNKQCTLHTTSLQGNKYNRQINIHTHTYIHTYIVIHMIPFSLEHIESLKQIYILTSKLCGDDGIF